jgi:D-amino-acid dehydrogenase
MRTVGKAARVPQIPYRSGHALGRAPREHEENMSYGTSDVLILGAGIVGISTAAHLQRRGASVVLVDRGRVAGETSFGNLGLIERTSLYPPTFPRALGELIRYATNRSPDARYRLAALPRLAPWLASYWWNSSTARRERAMNALLPLFENCISEHYLLAEDAGVRDLYRSGGWLTLHRTPTLLAAAVAQIRALGRFGLNHTELAANDITALEPHIRPEFAGGIHLIDPISVSDPRAVSLGIFGRWIERGGCFATASAESLVGSASAWSIETDQGTKTAKAAVVALGPWSDVIFRRFGYRIPLAAKRGYHMTYAPRPPAMLNHPVVDVEKGYALTPMDDGIRMGTGVEFAPRDAPPNPLQIEMAEPTARRIFPLGDRTKSAWMGSRPFIADLLPVLGRAPRHRGLWFAFGHGHHGFTLGPVTGRLMAEMLTGEAPIADPSPFSPGRFE